MDRMKEFQLYTHSINFDLLESSIRQFEKSNPDIKTGMYEKIPDSLVEDYISFSANAEKNTNGLTTGEISKISAEQLSAEYAQRDTNKFYYDVLAFDTEEWLIGKLSASGDKGGTDLAIYNLYVLEDFRGRKIGQYMLFKTIQKAFADSPQITSLILQTHDLDSTPDGIIKKLGLAKVNKYFY